MLTRGMGRRAEPVVSPRPVDNPLLDAFELAVQRRRNLEDIRANLVRRYAFAVPMPHAIEMVGAFSPAGVVELGAGTGYWARLLNHAGVDVVAFDIAPAPSPSNKWFAGTSPWHPIRPGDERMVQQFPRRTLLLVWPTRNEIWAADALETYWRAGGQTVVYVGEAAGGRTGDDVFHARLGQLRGCSQCRLGAPLSPCICGVTPRWRLRCSVTLPHWPGYRDDLHVFERAPGAAR